MGGTTGLDRYFGRNTHVLEVTDEQAVKAIQRVKSKLDSDNSLDQATTIASDIQTILLHAKPMNNNTNGDNH